jgi:hypothetical protein
MPKTRAGSKNSGKLEVPWGIVVTLGNTVEFNILLSPKSCSADGLLTNPLIGLQPLRQCYTSSLAPSASTLSSKLIIAVQFQAAHLLPLMGSYKELP